MSLRSKITGLLLALAATCLAAGVAGAWTHSTTSPFVVNNGAPGTGTMVVADGAGGVFTTWGDARMANYDVYVQHFDAAGNALWTPGGVALCSNASSQYPYGIIADGYGGAIVVWLDYRANLNGDFYARKVSSSGLPQWTSDGVAVTNIATYKGGLSIASDRLGGVLCTWYDGRNAATLDDIFLQRVNGSGSPVFTANGITLCNASNYQQVPVIATDAAGYCYVAWNDFRTGGADVYAQRITISNGVTNWAANGAAICSLPSASYGPSIVSTGANDVVIAWTDYRIGSKSEIYAQFLRAYDGLAYWTANGVLVASPPSAVALYALVDDGTGGYVAAFATNTNNTFNSLYAQRFDLSGAATWSAPGVLIRQGSGAAYNVSSCADGTGGVLVGWQDTRTDGGDTYVQRIAPSGYVRWRANGLPVANGAGIQQGIRMAAGATGGVYAAFDDANGHPEVQQVDEWGYLAAAPVIHDVADVPNDQGGMVKVSWYASPLDTDPLYRNITNYVVFRSVPPQAAARMQRLATSPAGARMTLGGRNYLHTRTAAQDYFWEELEQIVPRHVTAYSAVEPTGGDSMGVGNPLTTFMVEAQGDYGTSFWFTSADSGYSVDNVPPVAPVAFMGQYVAGQVALHWTPNTEADLAGYRLYRGTNAGFVPGPASLVAALADTGYAGTPGAPYYYKLTALDVHGNESLVASLAPTGTLAVETGGPAVFFLAPPAPSPVAQGREAALSFSLARSGRADLAVLDAAGRHVRTLAAGDFAAGAHRVAWNGLDDAGRATAPGLYFVRLSANGEVASRRLVRVQ
jgi:hypothetical protein